MSKNNISLTQAEWNLMECLWEESPRTGREAVEYLEVHVGWSRSTVLTLLRRMTEKGLILCEEINGIKAYSPLVDREEAVQQETKDFIKRVYKGSIGMLLSAFTEKQKLSKKEIDELYEILQQAQEKEE